MDVRIGIAQSSQVIELQLTDDVDREELKKLVGESLADDDGVLWLTDRKGKDVALAARRISFVEIGSADTGQRIGVGA